MKFNGHDDIMTNDAPRKISEKSPRWELTCWGGEYQKNKGNYISETGSRRYDTIVLKNFYDGTSSDPRCLIKLHMILFQTESIENASEFSYF